jgi:SAM-dependent methyltransferase
MMSHATDLYRSGEYEQHNPTYHVEDSPWKAAQVMQMLDDHGLRPRSICEVGCGAGEVLKQLELRTADDCLLTGYDINPAAERHWQGRSTRRLRFCCADILASNEQFDLCLCLDVVEHVPDCHDFLRRLRPKADWHIFHLPLDMNALMVLRGSPMRARRGAGHVHYFDKDTALATLRENGYEIVDYRYTHLKRGLREAVMRLPRALLAAIDKDFSVRALGGDSLLVLAK